MAADDYNTLVDQAEAEYVRALESTPAHLEAGKNLIAALSTKIHEISDLLGARSYFNPNSPGTREAMWGHFNAERENAQRRKEEVITGLRNCGFEVED